MSIRGKAWNRRRTNQKVRRVLGNEDYVTGKGSGRRLNRASWGCGLSKKDVRPKFSTEWFEQLDFDVTKDTRYWQNEVDKYKDVW